MELRVTIAVGGNGHIGGGLSEAGKTRYEAAVVTPTPLVLPSESECEFVSSLMYCDTFDCISNGS